MTFASFAGLDAAEGMTESASGESRHEGLASSDIQQQEEDLSTSEDSIQQAVSASQDWSRIIRRPRKRKGHIIVDICTAAGLKALPQTYFSK